MPHVGNIRTALYSWLWARRTGGQFIVRIEDTDRERFSPEAEKAILESLRWLGIDWDEGPEVGGPHGPYIQSQRLPIYQAAAEKLIAEGHAYRCWCTRERLEEMRAAQTAAKLPPGYDRACRNLTPEQKAENEASGLPSVVRFAVPLSGTTTFTDVVRGEISFENALLDDYVLLKSDGYPTYQLAAPLDDHLMGITHVVRGEEWISSAPKNIMVVRALGGQVPQYAHMPLILGADGKKLSKRNGDTEVLDFREKGYLPEVMVNLLALLGWSEGQDREVYTVDELKKVFDLSGVSRSPAVFDTDKLNWLNGLTIRAMSVSDLAERCLPYLQKAGLVPDPLPEEMRAYVESVVALEQERMKRLDEAPEVTEFFFVDELRWEDKALRRVQDESAKSVLADVASAVEAVSDQDWSLVSVEAAVRSVIEARGVKAGEVIHPTRAAVTGRTFGPGLFETMHVLGKAKCVKRLRATC
jgi:glutamyl-tRNA synthetase